MESIQFNQPKFYLLNKKPFKFYFIFIVVLELSVIINFDNLIFCEVQQTKIMKTIIFTCK